MPANPAAQNENPAAAADTPVFHDAAEEVADRAVLGGASPDHSFANEVAARTETPAEAAIDAANGLRGAKGRTPQPEDFAGLLTPAGNSGDIVGTDVGTDSPFPFGDDGALGGTTPP